MRQERVQGPCEPLRKAFNVTLGSHIEPYLGGQEKQGLWPLCIGKAPCPRFYVVNIKDKDGLAVEVLQGSAAA